MNDSTGTLWQRYRGNGDTQARNALIEGYLGLVHHSARALARRISRQFELDDLVSAGTLGLVQALEGFDPARGLAFSTYAMPRIRGAMLDEMRKRDWMPRTVRSHARQLAQASGRLAQSLGRAPEPAEVAKTLGLEMDQYWRWVEESSTRVMVALDRPAGTDDVHVSCLAETIPDVQAEEPGAPLGRAETLVELRAAYVGLPARERLVLSLYYYEGLNLKQIGEVLSITESRVSQIRSRALVRLREQLEP
ncbi:MAG TPA: FliA/WhiG family RNA polymerase sigma factor [Candidatus Saccharimonadaceae bacterium]|jgi:RNA polymerase sigma factor for flagellar operon FliA|nr:FliA/WhiG family RNA polymerase sigma factor [Candidatus Saccharimonadaceae bacterium]